MTDQIIFQKLDQLEKLIIDQSLLHKSVLNFEETCRYLNLSSSHLYKLTSKKEIPHFCPNNKKLYFKRDEIDQWLLRNRQLTTDDIEKKATNYLLTKKV